MTSDEWFWVTVMLAVPLLIFAAIELMSWLRRRRERAIAQRPKGPRANRDRR